MLFHILYDVRAPQRQCPSCHKENISIRIGHYNPKTRKRITKNVYAAPFWGVCTVVAIYVILYGILPFIFHINLTSDQTCICSAPVAGLAVAILVNIEQYSEVASAARVNYYYCNNCRHTWKVEEGKPL